MELHGRTEQNQRDPEGAVASSCSLSPGEPAVESRAIRGAKLSGFETQLTHSLAPNLMYV